MSFSSTRQSFVVALVAAIGSQMPSAANTPSGSQGEVVRADSIPVIVGPTVLAIVPGKLDSVAPALRRVREMASALGYTFRSEEHTSELQSHSDLVCRLLLEKKKGS